MPDGTIRTTRQLFDDVSKGNGEAIPAILGSYPDHDSQLARELHDQNGFWTGQFRLARLFMFHTSENLAEARTLRKDVSVGERMETIQARPTSSLVHIWTTEGRISPLETNRRLSRGFRHGPNSSKYDYLEIQGGHLEGVAGIRRLGEAGIRARMLRPDRAPVIYGLNEL